MRVQSRHTFLLLTTEVLLVTRVYGLHTVLPLSRESTAASIEKGGYTNKLYFATVTIGTPGSDFKLCMDTGSPHTWVPSIKCKSAGCSTLKKFDSALSTTYSSVPGSSSITINYMTGDLTGNLALETFSLGSPPITVGNQSFITTLEVSEDFFNSPCDGLMGLSMPNSSKTTATRREYPIFFNMVEQGLLDQPLFAIWLSSNTAASPAGTISFGALDPGLHTGSINYVPVMSSKFWKVALGGARVRGRTVSLYATQALTDSGSEMMAMGQSDAQRLLADIPQVRFEVDSGIFNVTTGCKDRSMLPNLEFQFGGEWLSLSPAHWVTWRNCRRGWTTAQVTIDEAGNLRPQAAQSADDAGLRWACIVAIDPLSESLGGQLLIRYNTIIFGAPLLRAYYTVYRRNGPNDYSMGFAPSV